MSDLTTRNNRANRQQFEYAEFRDQIDAMTNGEPVPNYYVDEDGDEVHIANTGENVNHDNDGIGIFVVGNGGNVGANFPPNFHGNNNEPQPPPNLLQEIQRIQLETGIHVPDDVSIEILNSILDNHVPMYSIEAVHLAIGILTSHDIILPEDAINSLIAVFEPLATVETNADEDEEVDEPEFPTVNPIVIEIPKELVNNIPYDLNKLVEFCKKSGFLNNKTHFRINEFIIYLLNNPSKMPKTCKTIADKLAKQKRNDHFFHCITQSCSMKEHTKNVCTSGNTNALTSLTVFEPNVCKTPNCIHHQMLCEYEPYCEFVKSNVTQQLIPPWNTENKVKPSALQLFPNLKIGKITKNMKAVLDKVALPKFLTESRVQNAFEASFNKGSYKFTTTLNDILYDFATQSNIFSEAWDNTSFYEQFVDYCLERENLDYEIFLDFADYVRYLNRFVFVNNLMWICYGYCEDFDGTASAKLFGNDYLMEQVLKFCK